MYSLKFLFTRLGSTHKTLKSRHQRCSLSKGVPKNFQSSLAGAYEEGVCAFSLFWAVGGGRGLVDCVQNWELAARTLPSRPSEVHSAGKLQWHFTCGFDFSHFCISEGVNHPCFVVPLGTMGPFSPGDN